MTSSQPPVIRGKPKPEDWPTFILDVDKWTICLFADVEKKIWLEKNGTWDYGVISYAWGFWHKDKTKWQPAAVDNYPQFDATIPVNERWSFPILGKKDDPKLSPPFTIQEVQKTLRSMKKTYVWWDWACLPQGSADTLKSKKSTIVKGASDLLQLQSLEVNKMRTVYSYPSIGCLWLHQTTWARSGQTPSASVQLALDWVTKMRIDSQKTLTTDMVTKLLKLLQEAQMSQQSFTSVWSFQEAICLHSSERKIDINGVSCAILDHNGERYTPPSNAGNNAGGTTGDYINDISNVVSVIIMAITDTLEKKANSIDLQATASPLLRDCYEKEATARELICKLIATGFSSYRFDNPLGLLESKWSRTIASASFASIADRIARGFIGALDVHVPPDILKQGGDQKVQVYAEAKKQGTPDKEAGELADGAESKVLGPAFFEALVTGYRWRMLLHARGKDSFTKAPHFRNAAWFKQFVGLDRLQFASLGLYIGDTGIDHLYQPRRDATKTTPEGVIDLPELRLSSQGNFQLVAKAKPTYKFYNFSTVKPAKAWSACQFYEYVKMVPDNATADELKKLGDRPGTIAFTQLDPAELTKQNGKLGDKVVLLPFETIKAQVLDVNKKLVDQARIRCFVLSDFEDNQPRNANFRGVADFAGLGEANGVFDKDLQIW